MAESLNIVLVQTQNYCGMGAAYVHNILDQLLRHLTVPYRVHLLTDDDADEYPGVHVIRAVYPGWWEKLRIFQPGLLPKGRAMFLDLDTVIVDNIDHIAAYRGPFATLRDFWRPQGLGPAVMLFDPEWASFIYQEWAATGHDMTHGRGDQAFIENLNQGRMPREVDILQDIYPGDFVSYKTHCRDGIPDGASVVCFHGKPRPHEVRGWVTSHWKELAHGE